MFLFLFSMGGHFVPPQSGVYAEPVPLDLLNVLFEHLHTKPCTYAPSGIPVARICIRDGEG